MRANVHAGPSGRDNTRSTQTWRKPNTYRRKFRTWSGAHVAHATAGTTDSTDEIYRLPVESYSPRSWEEEMNAIFRRLPLMLALSCELPEAGCYKAMKVLDIPVLIVRGEDMKPARLHQRLHAPRARHHPDP